MTKEVFIEKLKNIFGEDKFEYSKTEFKDIKTAAKLVCPKHGKFSRHPDTLLYSKSGCPKCNSENEFIQKARKTHGNKYDYSKIYYSGRRTKAIIICPKHGEFRQRMDTHTEGHGCKLCNHHDRLSYTNEDFIKKAREVHNNKYDYSKTNYFNTKTKVTIICPEHGEFEQIPAIHLQHKGCPQCDPSLKGTKKSFIKKARKTHGNKYDYSGVDYIESRSKVKIRCPKHGFFYQTPHDHVNGKNDCPKCAYRNTKSETEIGEFIKDVYDGELVENDREILNGKELDVYIPDKGLAIEHNGLYWHSEVRVDKNYHLNKTRECKKNNIDLIHIFEDEWLQKKEIVKSILLDKLNLTPNKIQGNKCEVREINTKEAREFCENNHLKGYIKSSIKLGLFYEDELVSIIVLNKLRATNGEYKITRFCDKINYNVIGGANILFNYFIKQHNPNKVVSYINKRYSNGKIHENIGFTHVHDTNPDYFYCYDKIREHWTNFKKHKLIKEGFDPNKSSQEIMKERKFNRIYDCGHEKYEYL